MKYYFSDNCFWDDEKNNVYRNGVTVKITPNQCKILKHLIRNNGRMVSHEELYSSLYGQEPIGDYKTILSNLFTRNKTNEKGLLIRVPEIKDHYETSKSQIGGGYKITLPQGSIIDDISQIEIKMDQINETWYTTETLSVFAKENSNRDDDRQRRLMNTYLHGGRCTWPIVFYTYGNNPVRRSITDIIKEYVKINNGIIVLTGAGGEGKSTILMQLCAELYKERVNVLFHKATYKYGINAIFSDGVYLIDNPNNSEEFRTFLADAVTCGATVVLAIRSNEWNILRETLPDETYRGIKEFSIPKIDSIEAPLFAACIKSNINRIFRNKEMLTALFLKESYGFLYASMLLAIFDKDSLEDITLQILMRIKDYEKSKPCLVILASIVFYERGGISINGKLYKSICKKNKIEERDPKYYLKMELVNNGAYYQTRHEEISKLFYKFLFQEGEWKPLLSEKEREGIVYDALEWALYDFDRATIEIPRYSSRVKMSFGIINQILQLYNDDEDSIEYVVQRVFESCRKYGYSLLYELYEAYRTQKIGTQIAEKCFESELFTWQLYEDWIKRLLQNEEIDKVREVYRKISQIQGFPGSLWSKWGRLEEEMGNIGAFDIQFSAAWVYATAYDLCGDSKAVIEFALFLERNNLEYKESPEDILKRACLSGASYHVVWLTWAKIMERKGYIGSYAEEGSAAWIYHKAVEYPLFSKEGSIWANWVRLITQYPERFPQNEKLAVLERGCLEYDPSTDVWNIWSKALIDKGEIGDYSKEKTAAWVLKTCCMEHNPNRDPGPWVTWIRFSEDYYGQIGEYSPVEIVRLACLKYNVLDSGLWLMWADLEEKNGNIGHYSEPYTAAWIYREASTRYFMDWDIWWIKWSRFALECHHNIGDQEGVSADEIIDMGLERIPDSSDLWCQKARIESIKGNIGDYTKEGSAAWLYKKACYANSDSSKNAKAWLGWAKFAQRHPLHLGVELIDGKYIIDLATQECKAFLGDNWLSLNDFKKEINYDR